jgi:hypothetical protein
VTALWYWLLFAAVAVGLVFAPWLCSWSERREDRRNAELWARMPGSRQ